MSLRNKLVIVTRSAAGSSSWISQLHAEGAKVINVPTITTSPVQMNRQHEDIMNNLIAYDWIVFTSSNGVRYFRKMAHTFDNKLNPHTLPAAAVIGYKTALEARAAGFKKLFLPQHSSSETLGQTLKPVQEKRILLLRTTRATDDLARQLEKRGARVTDLPVYQTHILKDKLPELTKLISTDQVDFIIFASPSAVEGFMNRLGTPEPTQTMHTATVALGPSVLAALQSKGFRNITMAAKPTIESVIDTLKLLAAAKN